MLRVGLTGNIGSGKSLVAEIFASMGIPVFNADNVAKQLLDLPENTANFVKHFGTRILGNNSDKIDRKAFAGVIFNDPKALELVNSVIHQQVYDAFNSWCNLQNTAFVIEEAAILFESGHYKDFDRIVVVTAPEQLRVKRVMDRDGAGEKDVLQRMKNQWPEERKVALADFVIVNDGHAPVIQQVVKVYHDLLIC
jgi:dephospho-CoA kinase